MRSIHDGYIHTTKMNQEKLIPNIEYAVLNT